MNYLVIILMILNEQTKNRNLKTSYVAVMDHQDPLLPSYFAEQ